MTAGHAKKFGRASSFEIRSWAAARGRWETRSKGSRAGRHTSRPATVTDSPYVSFVTDLATPQTGKLHGPMLPTLGTDLATERILTVLSRDVPNMV